MELVTIVALRGAGDSWARLARPRLYGAAHILHVFLVPIGYSPLPVFPSALPCSLFGPCFAFNLPRPGEEAQEFPARVPQETENAPGGLLLRPLSGKSFNAPAQIFTAPGRQAMAACGIPEKSESGKQPESPLQSSIEDAPANATLASLLPRSVAVLILASPGP